MSTKLSLKSATLAKKIDSPLAKYNSVGQLFCVLCNIPVKNEIFWTGHINGKVHREQLLLLKNKSATSKRPSSSVGNYVSDKSHSSEAKKIKIDADSSSVDISMMMGPPKSILKQPLKSSTISQSSPKILERDDISSNDSRLIIESSKIESTLNVTFDMNEETESGETKSTLADSDSIPAGFFDDAKEDAKARGIEYRNPEEAEWERFVKEMATEEIKSSVMRSSDEQESAKDRELDEIEEQMKNWQRVIELERKTVQIKIQKEVNKNNKYHPDEMEQEEDEDLEFEEDFDWRSKKY